MGILLVLVLVAVGVYALSSVWTTESQPGQGAAAATAPEESSASQQGRESTQRASAVGNPLGSPAEPSGSSSQQPTLTIEITGDRSYVAVRRPGGETLLNRTLGQGGAVSFHDAKLEVTVGHPDAVNVVVNGHPRDISGDGIDTFTVSRDKSSEG